MYHFKGINTYSARKPKGMAVRAQIRNPAKYKHKDQTGNEVHTQNAGQEKAAIEIRVIQTQLLFLGFRVFWHLWNSEDSGFLKKLNFFLDIAYKTQTT